MSVNLSSLLPAGQPTFSGLVRVSGTPGGIVYFRDGRAVAAATPAAPGPESLLLRSGRVTDAQWNRAYAAGAQDGRLAEELVASNAVGAAGLQVVCLTSIFDAVFAMALFGVDSARAGEPAPADLAPTLLAEPGIDPARLDRETARRIDIAAAWQAAGLTVRDRPIAVEPVPALRVQADHVRHAVLTKANGRRNARDISFALGRGLFTVMNEIAHLAADGLLTLVPPAVPPTVPPLPAADHAASRPKISATEEGSRKPPLLPRRRPGTSAIAKALGVERHPN